LNLNLNLLFFHKRAKQKGEGKGEKINPWTYFGTVPDGAAWRDTKGSKADVYERALGGDAHTATTRPAG